MSTLPFATQADFDGPSLHDDTIYGLQLDTATPSARFGAPILSWTSTTPERIGEQVDLSCQSASGTRSWGDR